MCLDRPGSGPAPVPSSTSLVPLASLSAACVCCGVQFGPAGCAALGPIAASAGAAAKVASRVRRERLDLVNVSVIVSLPETRGASAVGIRRTIANFGQTPRFAGAHLATMRQNGQ